EPAVGAGRGGGGRGGQAPVRAISPASSSSSASSFASSSSKLVPSGAAAAAAAAAIVGAGAAKRVRYFVMKSFDMEDVNISLEQNMWATQQQNQSKLN